MTAAEQGERPAPSEGQGAGVGVVDVRVLEKALAAAALIRDRWRRAAIVSVQELHEQAHNADTGYYDCPKLGCRDVAAMVDYE